MTVIKHIVGEQRYESIRRSLQSAFPDAHAVVTDAAVDTAFQLAKHQCHAPSLRDLAIPPLAALSAPPALVAPQARFQYYEAHATHARKTAPGSVFTGDLPLVRFQIPDHGTAQTLQKIDSPAGELLPVDRLYSSVDVLWATYHHDPAIARWGRPGRVDVIAPPRLAGARFAAVSLYLCYVHPNDPAPSFYLLEAGLATGQARMPFLGRSMDAVILAQTQYKPTRFAEPFHVYRGRLAMHADAPSEPDTLWIEVFPKFPLTQPYLEVTIVYERLAQPVLKNPFQLAVEAGARVQAIADALGVSSELAEAWLLRAIASAERDTLFTTPPRSA
ncbi:MAG: hypothetical protein RL701_443 [Pseudomonadota bacterium]